MAWLNVVAGLIAVSCGLHVADPSTAPGGHTLQLNHQGAPVVRSLREPCFLGDEVPQPKKMCGPRRMPLIIVAGEGKTGTESLSTALAMMGLKVAHFDSFVQCCTVVYEHRHVPNATTLGVDTGFPPARADPVCKTKPRYSGGTCQTVSWDTQYIPFMKIIQEINQLPIEDYDDFDWCQFDEYDVIADVPVAFLAPYIYSAYGSSTKVINTVRNVSEWVKRRSDWDLQQNLNDTAPMGWAFAKSINKGSQPHEQTSAQGLYHASRSADMFAYIAERSLIRCLVPPSKYLEMNIIDMNISPGGEPLTPEQIWSLLSDFLEMPTTGLDTSSFPKETPGRCHSKNVRATYTLVANATYHPHTAAGPYDRSQYASFHDFPPSTNWLTNLEGCESLTGPATFEDVYSVMTPNWQEIIGKIAVHVVQKTDERTTSLLCQGETDVHLIPRLRSHASSGCDHLVDSVATKAVHILKSVLDISDPYNTKSLDDASLHVVNETGTDVFSQMAENVYLELFATLKQTESNLEWYNPLANGS